MVGPMGVVAIQSATCIFIFVFVLIKKKSTLLLLGIFFFLFSLHRELGRASFKDEI